MAGCHREYGLGQGDDSFGSAIGEVGNEPGSARVNTADQLIVRNNLCTLLNPADILNPYDFDRDRQVNTADQLIARSNLTSFATELRVITAPANPATGLVAEVLSPSEVRLTWNEHSQVETGYSVEMASTANGPFSQIQQIPADSTACLLTNLPAGATRWFRVVPIVAGQAAAASAISVTLPERLSDYNSGMRWYSIAPSTLSITRNEAGYTGSGRAYVGSGGVVKADSPEAAVWDVLSGSATITNFDGETHSYSVNDSGAYDVGPVSKLGDHAGFDRPGSVSDKQWLLALEDTYDWEPYIDEDFDDFTASFDIATADLSVYNVAEDRDGGAPNEVDPGVYVVADGADLVGVRLGWGSDIVLDTAAITLSISGGDKVKVWKDSSRGQLLFSGGQTSQVWLAGSGQIPSEVWVEGIIGSQGPGDVTLTLDVQSGQAHATDGVKVTVVANPLPASVGDQVQASSYTRVDIHGVPLPDPSPTGDGESDRIPNMAFIDAAGLTPSFSTTDVAVPMLGGELVMEFRRTERIDMQVVQVNASINNPNINFRWGSESVLGAGWSTNTASRVILTSNPHPEAGRAPLSATIYDEVGNAASYVSSSGATYVPDVRSSFSNSSLKRTLTPGSFVAGVPTTFTSVGRFGTQLHYTFAGSVFRGSRLGLSGPTEYYYRLERIVDRNGNEIDLEYANANDPTADPTLVTRMYNPANAQQQIQYSYSGGMLTSVAGPLGQVYNYHYVGGLLQSVEKPAVADPAAAEGAPLVRPTVQFTYYTDKFARLTATTKNGVTSDAKQRVVWTLPHTITDARGNVTSFNYTYRWTPTGLQEQNHAVVGLWEVKPRLTSVTTADGTAMFNESRRDYFVADTSVTDTRGVMTTYHFGSDFTNQIVPASNDLGFAIVVDQMSRSVNVTDADGNVQTKTVTFAYSRDINSNLTDVTDTSGNVIHYEYNGTNSALFGEPSARTMGYGTLNLTTYYTHDTQFRKLIQQTDPEGKVTKYTLDAHGNRTAVIEAYGTPVQAQTNYTYDAHGFITSMTDPDGRLTAYLPNTFGQVEYTIVKGLTGEDLTPASGTSAFPSVDPQGKWLVTRQVTDVLGRTLSSYDALGNPTTYTYDNWNRVLSVTSPAVADPANPSALVTSTSGRKYDFNSNLVWEQDDNGNITTYQYDALNRQTQSDRHMASGPDLVTSSTYDAVGGLASRTDGEGHTTSYQYDAMLRVIKVLQPTVTLPNGSTTRYTSKYYFGANAGSGAFTLGGFNATRVVDAAGHETSSTYDGAYRLTQTVQVNPGGASPTTQTQYNGDGKTVKTTVLNENRSGGTANRVTYTFYDDRLRPTISAVDMDGDGVGLAAGQYVNDAAGFVADAQDIVTRMFYDGAGHVRFSTDGNGNTTETVYDGAGRAIQVKAPAITVYDPATNTTTTGFVPTTSTVYDAASHAILTTDPNGGRTQTQYDARGRVLRVILDLNGDSVFNPQQGASADDIVTSRGYDFGGNILYTVDPNGNQMDYVYDSANRATDVSSPAVADAEHGNTMTRPTTHTDYDLNGRATAVTDPRGIITQTQYDELGRVRFVTQNAAASATSSERLKTEKQYDASGNVTATIIWNVIGGTTHQQTTTGVYDALNRKTQETQADPDGAGGPLAAPVTHYTCDRLGELLTMTDPLGQVTSYDYDRAGRKIAETLPDPDGTGPILASVTHIGYDFAGNVITQTDALGQVTTSAYDALNRRISQTLPDPDGSGPLTGSLTQYRFDAKGQVTKVIDAMGRISTTQYDLAGRTVRSVNPDPDGSGPEAGGITTRFYDANGNVTQTVDALGNVGSDAEHHSTVSVYDALNRKTDEYLPYAAGEDRPHGVYGYDLSGNMQFRTDAAGNTTTYTIDALGRATAEQNELTDVRAMQYDSAGNVIQRTDRDGRVTRFEYDELNRKTAEKWLNSNSNVIRTFSFTFYADGKMASASDSDGVTTLFTYDAMGRVQTLDQTLPADASKHYVLTYGYDEASRLTSLAGTVANVGLVDLTYGYDDAGRLTRIIDDAGDKRVNFTYNSLGQYVTLTRYANSAGTELVAATTYGYDEANRLTSLVHALNDSGETMLAYALQYDVAGRITQLTTPDGASDLTLDNQGQLTGASLTDEDFTYDANGNRTSGGTVTGPDNRILEDSTYTYSYDDEGNLLSRTRKDETGSEEFTWDYRNRLTQVVTKDGEGTTTLTASYAYDAFDRRIRKTVTGSQTLEEQYLYDGTDDGDCVLVLDGSGNVKLRQLRGAGPTDVLAEDRISGGTTTTRWTLADHQGSIRDVVSDAAAVVDHLQYDSFGNVIAQTNAAEASGAGYTAAPTDAETGFVYLYHRYFDPRSGRFISQDPSGFGAGDANLYRYVGNDPYGRTDPTGLEDNKLEWAIGVQARFGFDGRGLAYQGVDLTGGVGYKVASDVQVRLDAMVNVYNGGVGTENQRRGFGWDYTPNIDATLALRPV